MKMILRLLCILTLLFTIPLAAAERVLLVVGNGANAQLGFDLGELAQAYDIFERNGFAVDIASPAGGKAHPKEYDDDVPYTAAFLADRAAMERLDRTLNIAEIDVARYAAMFLIGGSSAMHDFPLHGALQQQIAHLYERGGVIGAVCHGPAALLHVKLSDGRYLIDGKRISAFTEEEENVFGGEVAARYPFVLEQALRGRNETFEKAPMMLVQAVRDGRLVTGQNPFSTPRAAEETIRALGRTPKPRQPYRDEATVLLIAGLLRDDTAPAARAAFARAPGDYDPRLVAMYGARLLGTASDDAGIRGAVTLLELGGRHFAHPKVRLSLARAYLRLGERQQARDLLRAAATEFPADTAIATLLAELDEKHDHDVPEAAHPADRRRE
ncbi:MAG TPA: DJ-1/PfpI family protein [Thermoanaerobaculia bacterium]|nr:DJ-1/PfpI family protein [Thermoanaerobaculia bacterium]